MLSKGSILLGRHTSDRVFLFLLQYSWTPVVVHFILGLTSQFAHLPMLRAPTDPTKELESYNSHLSDFQALLGRIPQAYP